MVIVYRPYLIAQWLLNSISLDYIQYADSLHRRGGWQI
jgi:hypothetical protein